MSKEHGQEPFIDTLRIVPSKRGGKASLIAMLGDPGPILHNGEDRTYYYDEYAPFVIYTHKKFGSRVSLKTKSPCNKSRGSRPLYKKEGSRDFACRLVEKGAKVSAVHVAIDVPNGLPFGHVREALERKHVRVSGRIGDSLSPRKFRRVPPQAAKGKRKGESLYLGNKRSPRSLVIYKWETEPGEPESPVRIEIRYVYGLARKVLEIIADEGFAPVMEDILAYLSFEVPPNIGTWHLRPLPRAWREALGLGDCPDGYRGKRIPGPKRKARDSRETSPRPGYCIRPFSDTLCPPCDGKCTKSPPKSKHNLSGRNERGTPRFAFRSEYREDSLAGEKPRAEMPWLPRRNPSELPFRGFDPLHRIDPDQECA